MTRTTRTRRLAACTAVLALALTACGEDAAEVTDDAASAVEDVAADAADEVVDEAANLVDETDGEQAAGDGAVVVGMADYAFVDLPDSVPAGTTFTVDNRSETELHEFVAVRLGDDEERSAQELVQLPPEELGALFAEVRTVLLQAPGSPDVIPAVGDGTLDEPGRYLVICAIPTGADPQEYLAAAAESEEGPPEVDGGPPHLAEGMWGELEVTG